VSLPVAATIGYDAFYGCTDLETVSLPAATTIGNNAFYNTGGTALTITLGAAAPKVGKNMFEYVFVPKTVTVLVPNTGSAVYGPIPAVYSGSDTTNNWGNAFRGKGWDNTNGYGSGTVNSYITLNIKYITP
jgi:hypothetical protein